jgi:hypothetical protein
MRFGLKRSSNARDTYRGLLGVGEAVGWAGGGILLLHFDATGSGLLRPPSVQGEGLGSFRGLGRCSLSRRRGLCCFKLPWHRRRLGVEFHEVVGAVLYIGGSYVMMHRESTAKLVLNSLLKFTNSIKIRFGSSWG